MLISLPPLVIALTDAAAWLVIHLGMSWWGTRRPLDRFDPDGPLCRIRRWERDGRTYEQVLRIKRWKDLLPDGAAWFRGGFPKARLNSRDPRYLERFVRETARGERIHWQTLSMAPWFAIWNPPWAMAVIAVYALLANLPCIAIQRYNRSRLLRILRGPRIR